MKAPAICTPKGQRMLHNLGRETYRASSSAKHAVVRSRNIYGRVLAQEVSSQRSCEKGSPSKSWKSARIGTTCTVSAATSSSDVNRYAKR